MAASSPAAITGGPGVGKTTLITELSRRGFETRPEVARNILKSPGGMALRADRPLDFAMAMLDAQRKAWEVSRDYGQPIVFDRGFPDIVGFLRVEGLQVPAEIDRACRTLRFAGPVFRAPPWKDIYRQDAERTQDWQQALESDRAIESAWRDYGYDLIDLPLAGIRERADFVADRL